MLVWVVALAVATILAFTLLGDALTTGFDFTNNPEAKRADTLLEERLRGPRPVNEIVVVTSQEATVGDQRYRALVEGLFDGATQAKAEDGASIVARGQHYYQAPQGIRSLASGDGRITIIPLTMAGDRDAARGNIEELHEAIGKVQVPPGFTVQVTGEATIGRDFQEISKEDLLRGESFGVILALIILILVFGALVAAFLPVILAIVSIAIALGLAAIVGQGFELSFFITNFMTMIGLAVGIDYSLFIVQRYREERAHGRDKMEAIAKTGSTASRAVLFSGTTVVLALIGMLLVPSTVFRSLGTGAILVVIVSVLGSLTLLPALLSLLGDRVNRLSIPFMRRAQVRFDEEGSGGFWDTASRAVMRRPALFFLGAAGLLIAAAIPYFSINTGFTGVSTFPDGIESKEAFLVLEEHFAVGLVSPAEIAIDGPVDNPAVRDATARLRAAIGEDPAFSKDTAFVANDARDLALISAPMIIPDDSMAASEAIIRLREEIIPTVFAGVPAEPLVGGVAAFNLDFFRMESQARTPVFAFVLGMSFLLLMLVFRSVLVPLKATLLNLLSVGAAYGVLVLVFQKGWANSVFGFQRVDVIEAWTPLFLFSVLFGLSMDYHVFLLSRIRERYAQTGDNTGSVAFGIRSTGRLITGAALIMVAVFGGFAGGRLVSLEQMGFGLAVAILIDATLVRSILLPAAMKLLGGANWYLPNWLRWLPDFRVEAERPMMSGAGVAAMKVDAPRT